MEVSEDDNPDVSRLLYAVHTAFSYADNGSYTKEDLKATLAELLQKSAQPLSAPKAAAFDPIKDVASLVNVPVFYGYDVRVSQTSLGQPSVSGAFYSEAATSPELKSSDKAQPTAWETLVVRSAA